MALRHHALVTTLLLLIASTALADTYGLPPYTTPGQQWRFESTGIANPEFLVVRSDEEWAAFWKRHSPSADHAPIVDFSTHMVVGVISANGAKKCIYRIELDDARLPTRLEVRCCDDGLSQLPTRMELVPARVHLVVTPKSALPVRFSRDDEVDGTGVAVGFDEGFARKELATIKEEKIAKSDNKAEFREQAEQAIFATLTKDDLVALRKSIFPKAFGKRYPEPWSIIDVSRTENSWTIRYDTLRFTVDVKTAAVTRTRVDPTADR